jgi:hypothetical protein
MASIGLVLNPNLANISSTTACFALASLAKSITQSYNLPPSFTSLHIVDGSYSGVLKILANQSLIANHFSVSGIVFFFSTQSLVKLITIASSTIATPFVAKSFAFTASNNLFAISIMYKE